MRAASATRLVPILCVGETLAERESNRTFEVLDRQLQAGLDGLAAADAGALVVAYEPVWAIGTGRNATPEQAQAAHAHIRRRLAGPPGREHRRDAAHPLRRQRQARTTPARWRRQPDVDGALVGGAGLDAGQFRGYRGAGTRRRRYNRRLMFSIAVVRPYTCSSVCFLLLLVVLLQQGKGGDIAAAFGGSGSQAAFGARAGATRADARHYGARHPVHGRAPWCSPSSGQRGPGSVLSGIEAPAAPAPAAATEPGSGRRGPKPGIPGRSVAGRGLPGRDAVASLPAGRRHDCDEYRVYNGPERRAAFNTQYAASRGRKWRNWQTHQLEGLAVATSWGFKSPLPHQYPLSSHVAARPPPADVTRTVRPAATPAVTIRRPCRRLRETALDRVPRRRAPGGRPADYLRLLRPHQWVKNLLVFAPLVAAHETRPRALAAGGRTGRRADGLRVRRLRPERSARPAARSPPRGQAAAAARGGHR